MTTLQQKINDIQAEFEDSNIAYNMYNNVTQAARLFEALKLGSIAESSCSLNVEIKVLHPANEKPFKFEKPPILSMKGSYLSGVHDQLSVSMNAKNIQQLSWVVEDDTKCHFTFQFNGSVYRKPFWTDELAVGKSFISKSFKELVDIVNSQSMLTIFIILMDSLYEDELATFDRLPDASEVKEIVAKYNNPRPNKLAYEQIQWLDAYDAIWNEYVAAKDLKSIDEDDEDLEDIDEDIENIDD